MDFSDRVAVVTGGGGSLGQAIGHRLVERGATLVIAEIDALAGALAAEALEEKGTVRFIDVDVGDEPAVKALMERTITAFGRLDFLINCAGIVREHPLIELPLEDWQRVVGVNLTGAFLCAKHASNHLTAPGGRNVNVACLDPTDKPNGAASAVAGGLVSLTRALADGLAPHVQVNCISPGRADANRGDIAQGQASLPDLPTDAADLAVYLCSDRSGSITGHNFVADTPETAESMHGARTAGTP